MKGVEAIITWRDEETVHIWAVISDVQESVADRIYEVEASLQEAFDENFDFYVCGGPIARIREMLPPVAQVTFLKNS